MKKKITNKRTFFIFALLCFIWKEVLQYSYCKILHINEPNVYKLDYNPLKDVYALIWIFILLYSLAYVQYRHLQVQIPVFVLSLILIAQIIPISVVYYLKNENNLYYTIICIGMLLCIFLSVINFKSINTIYVYYINYIVVFLVVLLGIFLFYAYKNNGAPTLIALNIYDVYQLRNSNSFVISKYAGYLLQVVTTVVIPILLSFFFLKKSIVGILVVIVSEIVIYFYTGEKTFLFEGALILTVLCFLQKFNGDFIKVWNLFLIGGIFCCIFGNKDVITNIYDLIIRRVFILPANLKFIYHDFFSYNPKEGIAGIFPRWLINVKSNYGVGNYQEYVYLIGNQYFNSPKTSFDTGFIAEGFLRFGYVGIFVEFIVLAMVLCVAKKLQDRTSFIFSAGCCVYFAYRLSETHLIDHLLFGDLMVLIFVFLVYSKERVRIKIK